MSGFTAFAQAVVGLFFEPEPAAASAPASAPTATSLRKERRRYAWRCMLLGLEACKRYDTRRSFDTFHEAFVAFQQTGARKAASLMQKTIGIVAETVETPAKVRATFINARTLLQQAGLRDEEARTLFLHADFEARQSAYTTAYPLYEESLRLSRLIGYVVGEVECLCRYGWALKRGGLDEEAKRRILEARKTAQERGSEALVAFVMKWAQKVMDHTAPTQKSATPSAKPVAAGGGAAKRPWQPIQDPKRDGASAAPPPPKGSIAAAQQARAAAQATRAIPARAQPSSLKKKAGARGAARR